MICFLWSAMKNLKLFRICLVVRPSPSKIPHQNWICVHFIFHFNLKPVKVFFVFFCQLKQNRIYVLFGTDYKIVWSVIWQYNFFCSIDQGSVWRMTLFLSKPWKSVSNFIFLHSNESCLGKRDIPTLRTVVIDSPQSRYVSFS
jgi:hypothetical protein